MKNSSNKDNSYIELKGLEGIDIKKVLNMYMISIQYPKGPADKSFIYSFFGLISTLLLKRFKFIYKQEENSDLLFVMSDRFFRPDYIKKFNHIASLIDSSDMIYPEKLKIPKLKLNELPKRIFLLFYWYYFSKDFNVSCKQRIRITTELLGTYDFLRYMDKIDSSKYKALTVFFDAGPYENALVQQYQSKNIVTCTLQHGMFSSRREEAGFEFAGIQFRCFISDYFLAWNEYTKDEMIKEGIDSNRVRVLGIPQYAGAEFTVNKDRDSDKRNIFGVILDIPSEQERNERLIKFANVLSKEFGLKYKLRYHPNAKKNEFDGILDDQFYNGFIDNSVSIYDYSREVDFTIMDSSSVYIELILLNHTTFRYSTQDVHDKYLGITENTFSNVEMLFSLYKNPEAVSNNLASLTERLNVKTSILKNYKEFYKCIVISKNKNNLTARGLSNE